MREKLIELLRKTRYEYRRYIGMKDMEKRMAKTDEEFLAIDDSIVGEIPFCVDHLIANGVTIQKWIPVTERLPTMDDTDETGVVLVYTENNEHLIVDSADVWRFRDFITHWMPLPEPPKEVAK